MSRCRNPKQAQKGPPGQTPKTPSKARTGISTGFYYTPKMTLFDPFLTPQNDPKLVKPRRNVSSGPFLALPGQDPQNPLFGPNPQYGTWTYIHRWETRSTYRPKIDPGSRTQTWLPSSRPDVP